MKKFILTLAVLASSTAMAWEDVVCRSNQAPNHEIIVLPYGSMCPVGYDRIN